MDFLNRPFHLADVWTPASFTTSELTGLSISSAGPMGVLGEVYGEGPKAKGTDQTRYYIDNTGAVIAASKNDPPSYDAAATDVAIKSWGGTGSQAWILIYASEAIQAGHCVLRKTSSLPTGFVVGQAVGEIATGGAVGSVLGVAQHNIAADTYALILRKGVGYVQATTAGAAPGVNAGEQLIPSAATAGLVDEVAAAANASFGVALENGAGAFTGTDMDTKLVKAWINAQG